VSAPVRLPGLDASARYRVTLLQPWPKRAARRFSPADAQAWQDGRLLSGALLMAHGLALPLSDPQTAWLAQLQRQD
jgi:alpha-galactosidase